MDLGTERVHGERLEQELSCLEGTCTTSPMAPLWSQVERSGSHSTFVPAEASSGFISYFVSLFRVFFADGAGARHAGFSTSAMFSLVLLLCRLKVHINVWLTLTPDLPRRTRGPRQAIQLSPSLLPSHVDRSPGILSPLRARLSQGALLTLASLRLIARHSPRPLARLPKPRASPPPRAIPV